MISVEGATLRLEGKRLRRVFPVGVGRVEGGRSGRSPVGVWSTGPNPDAKQFYLETRLEPAFHRGHPFLRLTVRRPDRLGAVTHPFGIHGPVTPSLIWGQVSAGCIRMRGGDARALFRFARRHPGLQVRIVAGPDMAGGKRVAPDPRGPRDPRCAEAELGVRRLRRIPLNGQVHDRVCGGVDHWFAFELKGGDAISVRLLHSGGLRAELYGIRAISTVARGGPGFDFRVPHAPTNRGRRYLRIVAPARVTGPIPYTLELSGR